MSETQNTPVSGLVAGQLAAAVQTQEHLEISKSTIEQLGALTVAAAGVRSLGDAHFLVLPPEYKHVDVTKAIEGALPEPHRKSGIVVMSDLPSFLKYVADQATPSSCYIYAHPDTRALVAVLNDHGQGFNGMPAWRDFRVSYTAELSREFATWYKNDRKPMEQEEFAVFLEDNVADISEPSGETMLQVALTLQAKTEVAFSSHRRLDNGQVQLTYTENIDARAGAGDIMIPREFALGLRLFKNGDGYKVRARLKYRLGGGKVKFWYELDRVENAIEDAFNAYVEQARASGYPVLIGRP
ncbi:DUF2303 family protein [Massilia sp. Root1485]|uniref:DUF2303 family protein n=1 Tax=Massilia sp. Root1485 TaxID=1736472 RepID=UPI0006FFF970|nr:DUF2303 family protein [Massilia sp. Root1485]KQZ46354.1 hypothetical protein ASD92_25945 [Massilia sp. Root1485]